MCCDSESCKFEPEGGEQPIQVDGLDFSRLRCKVCKRAELVPYEIVTELIEARTRPASLQHLGDGDDTDEENDGDFVSSLAQPSKSKAIERDLFNFVSVFVFLCCLVLCVLAYVSWRY